MQTNALPAYDMTDNPTGCCPRFNPEGWDARNLHFEDKLFVRATTQSDHYIPLDMGEVFMATFNAIQQAGAFDDKNFVVLSRDVSPSQAEHFFAVPKPVPNQQMTHWNGDYFTKVFEGPYEEMPKWQNGILNAVESQGREAARTYYFYTTCPKCAETYGKNYIVAVAELADAMGHPT